MKRIAQLFCMILAFNLNNRNAHAMDLISDHAKTSKAVVLAMFDAFNRHDPHAMQALYHSEAVLTSSDFCKPRYREDVVRTYEELFTRFPAIFDDVQLLIVEDDWVAVRFLAKPNANASDVLKIMGLIRIKDGLIIEDDVVFNTGNTVCSP